MLLSDEMIQVFYRLLAAFLICAALTILTNSFFSLGNILNVLRQASLLFFIASGLTLVVLTGGLDLSIGANVAISACVAGTVIHQTGSPTLGVLTGIGVGGAVGMLNGVMVTALRIPSFIATYGMLWVLHGITYWYMGGETMHGFPAGFRQIGSGYFLGLPIPVYLLLVFLAIGTIFAQRTTWGQEIYAIGANPVAARLSGIPVARRLLLVYTVSGAMAGLASIIFLARLNSAEADIGESLTLPAIAAVLIGGTSLFGGLGTVFGTFVGALILTLVLNGMNLLSVNASWQPLVTGVIVILAVWLDMKTRRRAA
jgi:ribose transport system permease protein